MSEKLSTVTTDKYVVIYRPFINGAYVDPIDGEWIDSVDPYRNEVWARVPRGGSEDIDSAVSAAKAAMTDGPWAKIGDPMLPDTNIGPVTTAPQYQKILDYIDIAKSEGARLIAGGGPSAVGPQFVQPIIFTDVDDAVRIGNDVIYGLAASVWTQNMGRAHRMAKALKAGTIWVNTFRAVSYLISFGGMKHSGVGRENGQDAIKEYLDVKSVWMNTSDDAPGNPFVMR